MPDLLKIEKRTFLGSTSFTVSRCHIMHKRMIRFVSIYFDLSSIPPRYEINADI